MNFPPQKSVNPSATITPFARPNPNAAIINNNPANNPEALNPPVPAPMLPIIIGDTGTMRYGGFFYEDYDAEWADVQRRVAIVEQMRRGDAQVAMLLKACKAPILAAEWDVKVDSEDPKHKEQEEFIRKNIFGMKRPWKNFLRQALTSIDFGFSVFEICLEMKQGRFWLKDLAPRIQHSIYRWKLSDGTHGITQLLRTDEAQNTYVEIPINKLCIFTHDQEGDDITGIPVLRYAFKHWFLKNNLYQISAISAERFGVGIPYFKMPPGAGPQDRDAAESIAANLRSSEVSNIILPNGWDVQILTPQGSSGGSQDIKSQIDEHNRMILNAGLAGFLGLGTSDTGSFALEKGHEGFFLTEIENKVSSLAEEFTNQVIRRLIDLNFGEQKIYPKLHYTHVGKENKTEMATWINTLVTAGLLKPDVQLMEWARDNFKIVPFTEEQKEMLELQEVESDITSMAPPPVNNDPIDIPEPEEEPVEEEPAPEEESLSVDGAENKNVPIQGTALNGSQISSLKDIIMSISDGSLMPEAAKIMIKISFPDIEQDVIDDMVNAAIRNKTEMLPPTISA